MVSTSMYPTKESTIGVCTFLILEIPNMLTTTINVSKINAEISKLMVMPSNSSRTQRYALNPISAKADLSIDAPQSPSPVTVPTIGPNVRSMYT